MSALEDMRLSPAQREAVLDSSSQVLVAAGAGSGKTSLLVAYFVHALVDDRVPLEDLVAVTFTRKAAGELVARIRAELERQGHGRLAHSLDTGAVGTIHSLCRRLLRRHALEAGVDPAFGVLEADGAQLLQQDVAARVWAAAVEEADEAALAVLAQYQSVLRRELLPLYERLRGVGMEEPQVVIPAAPDEADPLELLRIRTQSALQAGSALSRRTATMDKAFATLEQCLEWAETVDLTDATADHLSQTYAFFPTRVRELKCHFAPVREALTACRCRAAQESLQDLVAAMNGLLARLHHGYRLAKMERSVLDFADLELRARALLQDYGGAQGLFLGDRARVMVDEFQDTNELQCSILEGLRASRLLMVGDERQSIYRFRGAEVEVFARRAGQWAGGQGALHHLDVNYRSTPEILAFVNHLFSQEQFFGAGYVALRPPAKREGEAGKDHTPIQDRPGRAAVEIVVVRREPHDEDVDGLLSIQEAEAKASARCVAELLSVDGREPRDVVILTPALTYAHLYQQELRARGIEPYLVRGKGYYSQEEIADVRAFLRVLVNPHDDMALAAVLRSPFVGLSDDGLYLLGKAAGATGAASLWDVTADHRCSGLSRLDRDLLARLRSRTQILRRRVGRPGLARLLDDAITLTGYDVRLLTSSDGARRFANIRKLMRLADEYETLNGPHLSGFVDVVQTMEDISDQEGSAATLAEGENVVRIMTIHQAKGLEFPVAVLTGLGSDNPKGGHSSFVVDSRGRTGVFLKGSKRHNYEDHDLCWGPGVEIVQEEREKEREEDVRLLYVAMTRAKEHLLLVGARQQDDDLGTCRIGRMVQALGVETLPQVEEPVRVVGLDATVRVVEAEVEDGVAASAVADLAEASADDGRDIIQSHANESGDAGGSGEPLMSAGPAGCPEAGPEEDSLLSLIAPASSAAVPVRVSFSGLAYYMECPRRFYLERMLNLRLDSSTVPAPGDGVLGGAGQPDGEDGLPDEDALLDRAEAGAGREVGLLVHRLLECSPLHGDAPSLDALRALSEQMGVSTGGAERSSECASVLQPSQLERALRLTQAFWSSPVAPRPGLDQALKEAPFCFSQDELLIDGVMDLVWWHGSTCFVVDYKTNSLVGRSSGDVTSSYRLQGALYSLAALRAGAADVQMDFLFLEDPAAPVGRHSTRDDMSVLESDMEEALAPLRAADYRARKSRACQACPLAVLCAGLEAEEG